MDELKLKEKMSIASLSVILVLLSMERTLKDIKDSMGINKEIKTG